MRRISDILECLHLLEERPYVEWTKQGKPINGNSLASALKQHHICPDTIHFPEIDKSLKGYYRAAIQDAFERYVDGGKKDARPPTPYQLVRSYEPPEEPPFSGDSQVVRSEQILRPENSKK